MELEQVPQREEVPILIIHNLRIDLMTDPRRVLSVHHVE